MIGVGVRLPGRLAYREAGEELTQAVGQLAFTGGQASVGEAQPDHVGVAGAEHVAGGGRLLGPRPRDDLRIGRGMRRLAVGDRDQAQPRARGGQNRDRSASAQDLVVGVGSADHDAGPVQRVGGRQVLQPGPFVPGFLGGTWPVDAVPRDLACVAAYHVGLLEATSSPS